ncbi:hypothetical protein EXE46_01595 [Halorubrum sp. GN11_10-6_MGM]|uniref:DUF5806 family protein n=1 Tax=Halorubrum sp. GN11_10-6_MGM TaxID=2518112 RepID=UPI0010F6001E|nr:DUF5806 family protein [Halorubrum sp. GN11_10-6_MGM]TKX75818.1 hypothetical protein EXE46_01595 [Halorubrum sp. GN11_10-6_MGM]
MSDHTGPTADSASETGDDAADRSPSDDDVDPDPRPADETDGGTTDAEADSTETDGQETTEADDESDPAGGETDDESDPVDDDRDAPDDVPRDVRKYERFKKMDGARYERVNEFLRDRTYITAREWAIARLCADFRTETGVEMTKIGENLPELVPFMTDTYTPQAVNQARYSFEEKVTKAGATFLYGAMSGFFTAEDLDEMMYEVTEVAKFLLEVEGVDLAVADELEAEDKISEVMRDVRASSADLRGEEVRCPECGHVHEPAEE